MIEEFIVDTYTDEDGQEIIEVDLNKSKKRKKKKYTNYMDEVENLDKNKKPSKDFISVVK